MKLSPAWLREFVDPKVDDRRLAQDLTSVGIAVENISGEGEDTVFEMEIGTNRPDAMNHYGVAREASVIYNLPLRVDRFEVARGGWQAGFHRRNHRQGRVRSLHRSHHSRRGHQTISRCDCTAACAGRSAAHQQRRRRHQLHAVGDGTSHARL